MARIKERFAWVLSDSAQLDPTQDIEQYKKIGAFWGGWRTWRSCQTDNVVCHDQVKAAELLKRNFQSMCNFYLPDSVYTSLDRPQGVKVYAGQFVHDIIRQEEIVAMHLAASTNDIVILLGWDLSKLQPGADKLVNNQLQHHRNMVRQAFITYDTTQWIIADHTEEIDPQILQTQNVMVDSVDSVLALVS